MLQINLRTSEFAMKGILPLQPLSRRLPDPGLGNVHQNLIPRTRFGGSLKIFCIYNLMYVQITDSIYQPISFLVDKLLVAQNGKLNTPVKLENLFLAVSK